jgi:hypothetical protein
MGTISLGQALHERLITVDGPRQLVHDLSGWGGVTPFATIRSG